MALKGDCDITGDYKRNGVKIDAAYVGAMSVSNYTTKGDLLAATGASAVSRVPVGTDGQAVVADSAQSTGLGYSWGLVPVGGVVSWLKSLSGAPGLPAGYLEANGQTVSDGGSPFNGVALPNLNGNGGATQRFLRGNTTSGAVGGTETHTHALNTASISPCGTAQTFVNGTATQSASTLPSYYEAVFVIRIK